MEDQFTVSLVALAVLLSASVSDWRRREAADIHWAVLMAMGGILFALRLHDAGVPVAAYLSVVSMALMAMDLLWDRDTDARIDLALYMSIIATAVISAFSLRDTDLLWAYVSMPVMYLVMNTFYYSGVVKGGADAKAVIAIAFPNASSIGHTWERSALSMSILKPAIINGNSVSCLTIFVIV